MSAYDTETLEPARTQAPAIPTRKATGRPSWPLIVLEGPEKTGKTWAAAELTATGRFSHTYWIDWGEGSADEYAAIPGADYEIVMHDGTFDTVHARVEAIHEFAKQQNAAGERPVLLVIDSMTAEWETLKQEADRQARRSKAAQRKLENDPDAEISIPMNLWNDASDRHYRFMRLLQTFAGVVVMIARGKEVAALDDNGRPTGERTYKVEGHKNLAYDASCWIRLSRDQHPMVVGARSVNYGIRPGVDKPRSMPNFGLGHVAFEVLLGGGAQTPQTRDLRAGPRDWEGELTRLKGNYAALRGLYREAKDNGQPQEYLARVQDAGKVANSASAANSAAAAESNESAETASAETESGEVVDGEVVDDTADPDSDAQACDGSGHPPTRESGDLMMTSEDGQRYVPCPGCIAMKPLDDNGRVKHHARRVQEPIPA